MEWEEIVELAKNSYGLKELEITETKHGNMGECLPELGKVILAKVLFDPFMSYDVKFIVFFHELGHLHCYNNDIHSEFHHTNIKDFTSLDQIPHFLEIAIAGEQWVDSWAAAELKKYFPRISYPLGYTSPSKIQWYTDTVTDIIKKHISKRELKLAMEV